MMELAFPRYEDDFALWVETQADLLRKREFAQLDIVNLLDELSDMTGHLRRELKSRMIVLLQHLLKCQKQPARPGKSWQATIREQRREITALLKQSPSLRRTLPDIVAYAYPHAVTEAADDTGLAPGQFPESCPWPIGEILGEG